MNKLQLGSHTVRSHGVKVARTHMHDWLILVLLVVIEVILYIMHPFYRYVGKDMMTDLKYPLKSNTVPSWTVPVSIVASFVKLELMLQTNHITTLMGASLSDD